MNPATAVNDKVLVNNVAMTNGQTQTANFDCIGGDYASLRFIVNCAAVNTTASANGASISVLASDDTNASNFATIGTPVSAVKLSQECFFGADTRAQKRYLRASVITGTAGVTNENITVTVIGTLSKLEQAPHAASGIVTGTNDPVPQLL